VKTQASHFRALNSATRLEGRTIMSPSSHSIRVLLGVLVIGVWGLLLRPYLPISAAAAQSPAAGQSTTYDTLTVQRINVVDPDGKMRLIIANSARMPGAIVHGKTYPRSIDNAAGVVFLDTRGEETGGIVTARLENNDVTNFNFDCTYQITDCTSVSKQESTDGTKLRESFDIFDRRPYTGRVESSQGVRRISLADENQNAQLVIADPQGRPRIRIGVDKSGEASIVMLSPDGKEVYRAGK
jgi:hypothetical protein